MYIGKQLYGLWLCTGGVDVFHGLHLKGDWMEMGIHMFVSGEVAVTVNSGSTRPGSWMEVAHTPC